MRLKNKSRKIARERYWNEHDKETYQCPDCGREEDEIQRGFEVHHDSGDAFDNSVDNLVALCNFCHCIREGRKPPIDAIEKVQNDLSEVTADKSESVVKSPEFEPPNDDRYIPMGVYQFVNKRVRARSQPWANPLGFWWDIFQQSSFYEENHSRLDLMNGLEEYSPAEIRYVGDHEEMIHEFDVLGVDIA